MLDDKIKIKIIKKILFQWIVWCEERGTVKPPPPLVFLLITNRKKNCK